MCSFTWSASWHPASSILYLISLSFLCVIFTWRHTLLPTVHSTPEDEISSTAILSRPCQLSNNHPFSFLAHLYLVTYIVFLFRILQFRTCPYLSPYFIFFIIWGNIYYSVERTTSVWTVSQFVDQSWLEGFFLVHPMCRRWEWNAV